MKAAIALQCSTGNCVYQDTAPPPTPSTAHGFWTARPARGGPPLSPRTAAHARALRRASW